MQFLNSSPLIGILLLCLDPARMAYRARKNRTLPASLPLGPSQTVKGEVLRPTYHS
jgi:hypothetical protein